MKVLKLAMLAALVLAGGSGGTDAAHLKLKVTQCDSTPAPIATETEAVTPAPTSLESGSSSASSSGGEVAILDEDDSEDTASSNASQDSESEQLLPNWVGAVASSDDSCYRKTYFSSNCSTGYTFDGIATCWAECPLAYPVECGMECLPQSDDCAVAVIDKLESVVTVIVNTVTAGVFGKLLTASESVTQGVKCGQQLFSVVSDIVDYATELETTYPNSTEDKLCSLLGQSDLVVQTLPTAVYVCLGLEVPTNTLEVSSEVADVVDSVVVQVVEQGESILSVDGFFSFVSSIGVGDSVEQLDSNDTATLTELISSGMTCGSELQAIASKVTQAVAALKSDDPTISTSAIRLALDASELFRTDIPAVTNNCVRNLTSDSYTVRDSLRTAMGVITDQLIDSSDDEDGNARSTADYVLETSSMGLDVLSLFDPTGIADMLNEFIQPICGPTAFMGEIDDGSLAEALALTTDGAAFNGSHGSWNHSGDGLVRITFESFDTENVTVAIHSGGDTIDKVAVPSGGTVVWNTTVAELQDKTLYLDRQREELWGLLGSGGDSLVLWIPRSSAGGHVELLTEINVS